jgi:hypothetical protein
VIIDTLAMVSSGGEIDAWMAELGLEEKLEARVS